MGGLATQLAAEDKLNQATVNYQRATEELANTPMYLEREILSSYNYNISNVSAEKKSSYKIIKYENKNF